jgi:multidrug resistance efflux pump
VKQGAPIFRLDSSTQEAAAEAARRKIAAVDAALVVARSDVAAADGKIQEARSAYQQAVDDLAIKQEINRRNSGTVAARDIERLQVDVQGRQGTINAATAAKQAAEAQISTLLPAQKASAETALAQAETKLAKSVVRAGVNGRVEQFALRVGDIVNPFMRPAGVPPWTPSGSCMPPSCGSRRFSCQSRSSCSADTDASRTHVPTVWPGSRQDSAT